ncbi:MAG: FprA family A-type flavoprotein [Anaerolineae bacterium]|nr:FprA family A-type flavoprotein [Anaerolineae bacterium]
MPAISIKPGIYWIGVNDRTTDLFEGLWPISEAGVSYNSYLVLDEKKVLIDLVKAAQGGAFLEQIYDLIDPAELDYVVLNHLEPDHTGAIKLLQSIAPQATFLCSPKAQPMLAAFYGLTDRVRVVKDGEELSIGATKLQFFSVPFVHWPETMVTYAPSQGVLFSCDAFGGYGALRGAIFDDDCVDMDYYIHESLRYYVNIVARFSGPTLKAIDKLAGVPIEVIAPSHGLVWRGNPTQIVKLYQKWASLATQPADPGVTLIYGSMYGNTEDVMNAVAEGISKTGLPLEIFDAARTHASYVLPYLWIHNGVMVGAPTYEVSLFPPVAQMIEMAAHKRILNRKAAYFGSYGWSGGAKRDLLRLTESLKWDWVDTLEFQGGPTNQDLHAAEAFGERFAQGLLA